MTQIKGRLYFRRIEIVDDCDMCVYKDKNISVSKGLEKVLTIVGHKDGKKTLKQVLVRFVKYIDDDFKYILNIKEDK